MSLIPYCLQCDFPLFPQALYYRCTNCKSMTKYSLDEINDLLNRSNLYGLQNSWVVWEIEKHNIIVKDCR